MRLFAERADFGLNASSGLTLHKLLKFNEL